MRSFIKIYGPPVLETIKTLEKIAVDMPEVSIMDTLIVDSASKFMEAEYTMRYFSNIPAEIEYKRCNNIISKSGEMLGEYDFFFEWFTGPSMEQLNSLIKEIDEALTTLGCRFSITTKK